ncbi:hypothetical protein B4U80_14911 [Leptotrombidium deliense]|uniref:Uncharacterized protein n=1 Tax=Leptotrombidium deliense TaxID=299467 RepID=A0A443S271_9ACAR|nr:hypothetical protein B4U80_14911 [Leptotrombidium deliense]
MNSALILIADSEVQRFDTITDEKEILPISDFLGLPSSIDAAFNVQSTGKSYILKRSFYYEFDISYIRDTIIQGLDI